MVNGLKEDEARDIAAHVTPIAMKYGIEDITLHAHGDNPGSIAAFMHEATKYGIANVRGDIVHRNSGRTADDLGTFPNIFEVIRRLDKLGTTVNMSPEQEKILNNIE